MKLSDLLRGVDILAADADFSLDVSGVQYDSRKVRPGDVFIAITGFATDGNRYIEAALEQGAVLVVTDQTPPPRAPYALVSKARLALAQMGANWYGHPAKKLTLVGVTGTNGKTSVTWLLKSVLEQARDDKVGLIGTVQNMIGEKVLSTERTTPESWELQGLLADMVQAGCTHVVMEVSSHALALDRVGGIDFQVGVFTNLTEDHLDFHGTMQAYQKAKAQLFQQCEIGVFNLDDPYCEAMQAGAACRMLTTSLRDRKADLWARDLTLAPDHIAFTAVSKGREVPITLGIPGAFTAYNTLSVLGAAVALGIPLEAAACALRTAKGVKGRIEVVPTQGMDFTVFIDYAHTPDGLKNILHAARGFSRGRVVALVGCGGDRDRLKRPIMGRIAVEQADFVVFTSDNPRTEDPMAILQEILAGTVGSQTPYVVIQDRREAIRYCLDHGQEDDVIVLAGKGHETYQEVAGQKRHLDEREEVAAWLAARHPEKEVKLHEQDFPRTGGPMVRRPD